MSLLPLMLSLGLIGQAPSSGFELADEVQSLVRELNERSAEKRDAAEEALVELGPEILVLLPDPETPLPAESEARLKRVRSRLQFLQAEQAARASPVTLSGRMSLLRFFEKIEQQTGNRVLDLRDRFGQEITNPELEIDFDAAPFWQALDDVLARTDTTVYPFPGEAAVAIVNRGAGETGRDQWAAYSGAFRFEPTEFVARRNFSRQGEGTLRLRYQVSWEPRLRPILLRQRIGDLKLFTGGELYSTDADDAAVVEIPTRRGTIASEFEVPLKLLPAETDRVEKLTGRLEVLLPSGTEKFRFEDLSDIKTSTQRHASTTVTIEKVWQREALSEIRIRVGFDDPGEALESHRGWVFNNDAYLENSNGERVEPATLETIHQTETEVGIAYIFALDDLSGHAFVYETPVLIQRIHLDYELRDLPLP